MNRLPIEDFKIPQYDDQDVINSWKWLMSYIPKKDWEKRKANIEKKILIEFRTTQPFTEPLAEGTLLAIKDDVIGWYLYLIETLIYEPQKYEYYQGARVVPIFKRLGAELNTINNIGGINKRVKDLLKRRISEADAILFEILTALLWAKNGYQVDFITENSKGKTPDLIATKDGETWNIECKRQSKTSDYTYRETVKRQKMVSHIAKILLEHNILLDIVFHVEVESLPDTYLRDILAQKLKLAIPGRIISNNEVDVVMTYVDLPAINRHLDKYFVKNNSPMLNRLIAGKTINHKAFTCGIYAEFYRVGNGSVNNLYISSIAKAYGIHWTCDSKEAVWAKARDIKNQLHKAMQQFNPADNSVVHFGLETLDGPEVERTRFEKIMQTIVKIDITQNNLKWIFCHFFQAYSVPEELWFFDESISIMSSNIESKPPISITSMIVPEDENTEEGIFHWERPHPSSPC